MKLENDVFSLLQRRGIEGYDDSFDINSEEPVPILWSFKRKNYVVIVLRYISKANAIDILSSLNEYKCILIYTDRCTPCASNILKKNANVEVWSENELCLQNPFKYNFIEDAGIVNSKEDKWKSFFEVESDPMKYPKIKKSDPLARHIGAVEGDIVWVSFKWGTLESEIKLRLVI